MELHLFVTTLAVCIGLGSCQLNLFPPKYAPGDTMTKTDHESVDNALDDVLRAGGVLEGRRCAIGVANLGNNELVSPKWYVDSGVIFSSAPFSIPARKTGLTLFHKRAFFIWGSTGLLTYDIAGTDYKVAMLWQVPWNKVMYNVLYNVKVYNKDVPTDKNMFNQMMKYTGVSKSTGWINKNEYGIELRSTITSKDNAKLYTSVDSKGYDTELGPQLHTECDSNKLWFGKYCWQECVPTGYCWSERKCNTAADCLGPLLCYSSCKKT